MVSIKSLVILAFGALTSAEYLGIVEITGQWYDEQSCHEQAPIWRIMDYGDKHIDAAGGRECNSRGRLLASNTRRLEGCSSGWNNGYRVCTTSYGANVHKNGKHQRCIKERTTVYHCLSHVPCWETHRRVMKCEGKWHNDT
ncbi:hypothetical protein QBC34DRAFT_462819 [Podospora aff. communis PSN243]|uniref:Cyanovirin-N domain-containing protein n=1 Tax=Podospora aff. communis PSN243 TaxID=3040156 RepID=A0AAV9GMM9_9PEZI|nr:hypothetical protein QBC34DRAFT_462819 [Podospora aff. communis PSN243]